MDADSDGFVYVGIRRADYDTEHTGVLKLDRDWNIVASIGFGKPGDPVFNAVHDIAVGDEDVGTAGHEHEPMRIY